MGRFQHILFPFDCSDRCKEFGSEVSVVARHTGAKVTLLHVFQILPGWIGGVDMGCPIAFDDTDVRKSVRMDFERFCAEFGGCSGLPHADTVLEEGDPASTIIRFAERNGVDLIMMPTHGCGTFRRFLLGSVTSKVLHDFHGAVWTAAHRELPHTPDEFCCHRMLCAVNLKPEAPV